MEMKIGLLLAFLVSAAQSVPVNDKRLADPPEDYTQYRLPDNVVDKNEDIEYDIELTVDEKLENFQGTVILTFTTATKITEVRLNSKELTNLVGKEITLKVDGTDLPATTMEEKNEILVVKLDDGKSIDKGKKVTLTTPTFNGKLAENMLGFYKSTYDDEILASTQFEPTYARRAFPCFDEPSYKAVFKMKITYPVEYNCLFNSEEAKSKEVVGAKEKQSIFEPTPKMPTYLVAFVISKFTATEDKEHENFKVWSRESTKTSRELAVKHSYNIMEALKTFTDIDTPAKDIPKMDQVAVPDFQAGAMENWGLVTYRETALLFNEEKNTNANKQRVASVIAHEFAHQWFGNLVTLDWWSNTWLNEGFATFFENFIIDQVFTESESFEMDNQFVVGDQQSILLTDALKSSAPLSSKETEVFTLAHINNKFSSLTYSKGGAVLRMISHIMGIDTFKAALTKYLTDNAHGTVTPNNLFKAFDEVCTKCTLPNKQKFEALLKSWVFESGFPVLHVNKSDNKIIIDQEKFLFDATETAEGPSNTIWSIPISYTTDKDFNFDDTTPKMWLTEAQTEYELGSDENIPIFNIKATGYYRVNYVNGLWDSIKNLLLSSKDKIHTVNRAQIVDDVMNLARAGYISYAEALDVANYLENETDYYPWVSAFNTFNFLRMRLGPKSTTGKAVSEHLAKLMLNLYNVYKFDEEQDKTHVESLKQMLALEWACELDNNDCVTTALDKFKSFKETPDSLRPEFKSTVYCMATRNDDDKNANYKYLLNILKQESDAAEVNALIKALGCSTDVPTLEGFLKESIDQTFIRSQDANYVFSAVLTGNPEGVDIALDFLTKNWEKINEKYGALNAASNLLISVSDRLTTFDQASKILDFIDGRPDLKDTTEAKLAKDNLRTNMKWNEEKSPEILIYFIKEENDQDDHTDSPGAANMFTVSFALIMAVNIAARVF